MRVTMSTANKMGGLATIAGTVVLMTILSSNAAVALRATMSLVAPRYCFNSQGHRHCGFHTWAQCQAARHGLGGGASENPARRGRRLGASVSVGMEHVINAPAKVAQRSPAE